MKQRFCPNCGSIQVEPDNRHTNVLGEFIFNQDKWLCRECGYTGLMPETAGKTNEFENIEFDPVEQEEKIDTDAGRGMAKYYIYILIPALILYYIYLKLV
jgi:ribosomal protein S27AE